MDTTNKPVAWIANDVDLPLKEDGSYWLYPKNPRKDNLYIPLYTHPHSEESVKVKELTDEEIIELGDKHLVLVNEYIGCGDYVSNIEGEIEFARAILRKAQEK